MATESASDDVLKMECFICSQLFTDPKLLPCFHTFCRHCLLSVLAIDPQAPCPLCKLAIADPTAVKREGVKDVVDDLPTDLAMEALVNSVRFLRKDHVCSGCCNNAAVQICLTCGDAFCEFCSNAHQKMSATRNHKVEDLSTMTPARLAVAKPAFCCVHSDRPAQLFCQTHAAAICPLCATSEHRACAEVTLFDKRVEMLRAELAEMSTKLQTAETELDKIIRKLDQRIAELEIKSQKAVSDIDADCDRLENALKDCRRRLKQQALSDVAEVKDKVQAVKNMFLERKQGMTTKRISAERIQRAVPSEFLSDVNLTLKSKLKDLNQTPQLPPDASAVLIAPLTIDREALERLEKELNKLWFGQVTPIPPEHDCGNDIHSQVTLLPASDFAQVSTESSCFDLR